HRVVDDELGQPDDRRAQQRDPERPLPALPRDAFVRLGRHGAILLRYKKRGLQKTSTYPGIQMTTAQYQNPPISVMSSTCLASSARARWAVQRTRNRLPSMRAMLVVAAPICGSGCSIAGIVSDWGGGHWSKLRRR